MTLLSSAPRCLPSSPPAKEMAREFTSPLTDALILGGMGDKANADEAETRRGNLYRLLTSMVRCPSLITDPPLLPSPPPSPPIVLGRLRLPPGTAASPAPLPATSVEFGRLWPMATQAAQQAPAVGRRTDRQGIIAPNGRTLLGKEGRRQQHPTPTRLDASSDDVSTERSFTPQIASSNLVPSS